MNEQQRKYTESERFATIATQFAAMVEFGEYLKDAGVWFCELNDKDQFMPIYTPVTKMAYKYFDIDPDKLEMERRAMLDEMRRAQEKP